MSSRRIRSSLTISEFRIMVRGVRISYIRIKQENEELTNHLRIQNNGKSSEDKLQYKSIKQKNEELTNHLGIQNNGKRSEDKLQENQAGE
jgi:hypothetical protein